MNNWAKVVVGYVVAFSVVLFTTELSVELLLGNPSSIPENWAPKFREYYFQKDRKIAQYLPDLAVYDEELFYRLNPGKHQFSNAEFNTDFKVNSAGLRDDEPSLNAPEIITLGDSYTMGWGVESDDAFPSIIEKKTGLKVLNAGISSYGTAREWKLLQSLDKSNLKYLILQFDANDNSENVAFFHKETYKAPPRSVYENIVRNHNEATAYFPLKHISHFVRNWAGIESKITEEELNDDSKDDKKEELPWVAPVDAFMKVLHSDTLNKDVTLIIFQVGGASTDILIDRLNERKAAGELGYYNDAIVLDIQQHLNEADYFILDGHLTKKGHEKVAMELLRHLN